MASVFVGEVGKTPPAGRPWHELARGGSAPQFIAESRAENKEITCTGDACPHGLGIYHTGRIGRENIASQAAS